MNMMVRVSLLALLMLTDGALAFHAPSTLPGSTVIPCKISAVLRATRRRSGALAPLAMSFVPDKEAMKKNFAKVPDQIILRDPVQLTDATTKVVALGHLFSWLLLLCL